MISSKEIFLNGDRVFPLSRVPAANTLASSPNGVGLLGHQHHMVGAMRPLPIANRKGLDDGLLKTGLDKCPRADGAGDEHLEAAASRLEREPTLGRCH